MRRVARMGDTVYSHIISARNSEKVILFGEFGQNWENNIKISV